MELNLNIKDMMKKDAEDEMQLLQFFKQSNEEELHKYLKKVKRELKIDVRSCSELSKYIVVTRGIRELFKIITSAIKLREDIFLLLIAPKGTGRTTALRYISCLLKKLNIEGEVVGAFYSTLDFEDFRGTYLFVVDYNSVKLGPLKGIAQIIVARFHPYRALLEIETETVEDLEKGYQFIIYPEPTSDEVKKIVNKRLTNFEFDIKYVLNNPLLALSLYKYDEETLGLNDFSKIDGLSEMQFKVLFSLCEKPKSLRELANELNIKKPTVHHHISKLEELMLVSKFKGDKELKYRISKLAYQIYTERIAIKEFLTRGVIYL